ncbi:hypothetical protein QJS25_gp01 [Serratia phage vB_SmaS_Bonzee]|uniref:hypothetical protein n=1 Tax=Serratia phage vB_SmaS_Bonzee TaxID=2914027 RepID=UPI002478346F|nr:hypothetical protein QJS25_gp01 [Serratia phage vB_SmaS_Bonzee]UKL15139.1 hypothetical protein BONZEE_1 [Serratia phage vB_SmaS_Bonzee]
MYFLLIALQVDMPEAKESMKHDLMKSKKDIFRRKLDFLKNEGMRIFTGQGG